MDDKRAFREATILANKYLEGLKNLEDNIRNINDLRKKNPPEYTDMIQSTLPLVNKLATEIGKFLDSQIGNILQKTDKLKHDILLKKTVIITRIAGHLKRGQPIDKLLSDLKALAV